ncbi:hypothetical protein AB0B66_18180 [Catellatospora sp. NPDC049111]|uniref:hypothetical protein n=1 Tax=Catellatospora sp. NPDC049111 TaxID=3155271 RepID=UPI0033C7ADFF
MLAGVHRGRVDLVVDLDPAAAQDQPQRAGRRDGGAQRDLHHRALLEAGNGQPQSAAGVDAGVVLVGAYHDLVVGAVAAAPPGPAHLPGPGTHQQPTVRPSAQ